MPNLTMYISADDMPSPRILAGLTERCSELCTVTLHAALENVHIMYVPVIPGRGHVVYAELLLRDESFRPPALMDRFMQNLDAAITEHTGLTARIRCFSHSTSHIHARN